MLAPAAVRCSPDGTEPAVSTHAHLARGCGEPRAPARGTLTAPRPRTLAACPTARCTRASGGRPTATVLRAPPSSRGPPGALPRCPLRAPSRCLPLPRACRQQRPEMPPRVLPRSLAPRLVGRWSHGNDRKQWQSDLSAVWTKQQVPVSNPPRIFLCRPLPLWLEVCLPAQGRHPRLPCTRSSFLPSSSVSSTGPSGTRACRRSRPPRPARTPLCKLEVCQQDKHQAVRWRPLFAGWRAICGALPWWGDASGQRGPPGCPVALLAPTYVKGAGSVAMVAGCRC